MNNEDKKEFARIMTASSEVFGKQITKPLLSVYFESLSNFTIEQVKSAFSKHLLAGKFFPKPADIAELLKENELSIEDRALLAWSEVENAIKRTGSWGSPVFTDPITPAAVGQLGSWSDLCMTTIDNLAWKQKEFLRAFELFEKTPQEYLPCHVKGKIDVHNERLEVKQQGNKLLDGINTWREKNGQNKLEVKK